MDGRLNSTTVLLLLYQYCSTNSVQRMFNSMSNRGHAQSPSDHRYLVYRESNMVISKLYFVQLAYTLRLGPYLAGVSVRSNYTDINRRPCLRGAVPHL